MTTKAYLQQLRRIAEVTMADPNLTIAQKSEMIKTIREVTAEVGQQLRPVAN